MKFGKARFYADENIETFVVDRIREEGFRVDSAVELGLSPRDDRFHLQEARRRRCVLLTKDTDFLDNSRFPFHELKDTAIVVLRTEPGAASNLDYGYLLFCLFKEIGASGNKNLFGMKIEVRGPKMTLHARVGGKIRKDVVDISKETGDRDLFKD